MFRTLVISVLAVGIANAIHDDHGGQQTEPNLPVSSPDDLPANDEDADDVVPVMQTFISFPLNMKERTLRVVLFKNTVDCSKVTDTVLRGQNFTWLHTKDELLSKYDEPYLGAEALVAADKTNGRPLFLMMGFFLGKFEFALEPSSEQLVGCRGPNRNQLLATMKIWGKTHHLYNLTLLKKEDPTTEAPTTLDPSTPKTTTPRTTRPITTTPAPTVPPVNPPGIEFEVVLTVLIVVLMVIIVVVGIKRKPSNSAPGYYDSPQCCPHGGTKGPPKTNWSKQELVLLGGHRTSVATDAERTNYGGKVIGHRHTNDVQNTHMAMDDRKRKDERP